MYIKFQVSTLEATLKLVTGEMTTVQENYLKLKTLIVKEHRHIKIKIKQAAAGTSGKG